MNKDLITIMMMVLPILSPLMLAQDASTEIRRSSLEGLSGVNVLIEELNPEVEELGLTTEKLQTDAELRLRTAGIRVLTKEETFRQPGHPYLYINVNILVGKSQSQSLRLIYNINIMFRQDVKLSRNPDILVRADTWQDGEIGLTYDIGDIRNNVKDYIDVFTNDYLAANPKE